MDTLAGLLRLIRCLDSRGIPAFSGLGLIVYETLSHLPCLPLAAAAADTQANEVVGALAEYSQRHSERHDGFHLLNRHFQLTHSAHYIAPPVSKVMRWKPSRCVGARTMTALLASSVEGILLTASVSSDHSVRLFQAGKQVFEAIGGLPDG